MNTKQASAPIPKSKVSLNTPLSSGPQHCLLKFLVKLRAARPLHVVVVARGCNIAADEAHFPRCFSVCTVARFQDTALVSLPCAQPCTSSLLQNPSLTHVITSIQASTETSRHQARILVGDLLCTSGTDVGHVDHNESTDPIAPQCQLIAAEAHHGHILVMVRP